MNSIIVPILSTAKTVFIQFEPSLRFRMETTKIPLRNITSKPRITLPIFIILGKLKTVYQRVRTISMSIEENREPSPACSPQHPGRQCQESPSQSPLRAPEPRKSQAFPFNHTPRFSWLSRIPGHWAGQVSKGEYCLLSGGRLILALLNRCFGVPELNSRDAMGCLGGSEQA